MNHYKDFVERVTTSYVVCPADMTMEELYGWLESIQESFVFPSIRIRLYTQRFFPLTDSVYNAIKNFFKDVAIDHVADVSKYDIEKIEKFINTYTAKAETKKKGVDVSNNGDICES